METPQRPRSRSRSRGFLGWSIGAVRSALGFGSGSSTPSATPEKACAVATQRESPDRIPSIADKLEEAARSGGGAPATAGAPPALPGEVAELAKAIGDDPRALAVAAAVVEAEPTAAGAAQAEFGVVGAGAASATSVVAAGAAAPADSLALVVPAEASIVACDDPAPPLARSGSACTDIVLVDADQALDDATLELDRQHADGIRAVLQDLQTLAGGFSEQLAPLMQLRPRATGALAEELSRELGALRGRLAAPMECRIVVFGSTGAGKSTLLNSLLFDAAALPTSSWRACTSTPVEIAWSGEQVYRADVELKSLREWEAEVKRLLGDLRRRDGRVDRIAEPGPAKTPKQMAYGVLRAVYPECMEGKPWPNVDEAMRELQRAENLATIMLNEPEWWRRRLDEHLKALEVKGRICFGNVAPRRGAAKERRAAVRKLLRRIYPAIQTIVGEQSFQRKDLLEVLMQNLPRPPFECEQARPVSEQLCSFVESPDDPQQAAIWPLVKKVRITGPFRGAHPFTCLVDAPGVEDADAAREQVVSNLLKDAHRIVIASNIKRAVSEKVAQSMFNERFQRQMLTDGHMQGMAFVATQTDEATTSELKRNLNCADDVGRTEAGRERNRAARETLHRQYFAGWQQLRTLAEEDRLDEEEFRRRGYLPSIFCTSSHDYQKLTRLLDPSEDGRARLWERLEDTEIPQLRAWVHAQGQRFVADEVRRASSELEGLAERLLDACRNGAAGWQPLHTDCVEALLDGRLRAELEDAVAKAGEELRNGIAALRQRVQSGVNDAAQKAADEFVPRCKPQRQGGLNWNTFKAFVVRDGKWKEEDWNEILSAPLSRHISIRWSEVFTITIPQVVIPQTLKSFEDSLRSVEKELDGKLPEGKAALLLQPALALLKRLAVQAELKTRELQQQGSRTVKEATETAMKPTYQRSSSVAPGPGIDERQKKVLRDRVQDSSGCSKMLGVVGEGVEKDVDEIVGWLLGQLSSWVAEVAGCIRARVAELQSLAKPEKAEIVRRQALQPCSQLLQELSTCSERLDQLCAALDSKEKELARQQPGYWEDAAEDEHEDEEDGNDEEGEEEEEEAEEDDEEEEGEEVEEGDGAEQSEEVEEEEQAEAEPEAEAESVAEAEAEPEPDEEQPPCKRQRTAEAEEAAADGGGLTQNLAMAMDASDLESELSGLEEL